MFQCILHFLRTIYLGIIKQKNHLVSHFFWNETLFDHEQDVVDTHHVGLPCVSFLLPIWDVSSFKSKYKSTWHENHWLCKSNIFSRFTNLPRGHCSLSLEQLAPKKINFAFRFLYFGTSPLDFRFQISVCHLSVGLVIADKCWPQTMAELMEEDVVEESILGEQIAFLYFSAIADR